MNKVYTKVQFDPNNNRKTRPSKTGRYPVYLMVKQLRKKERIKLNVPNISFNDFQDKEGQWVKKSVVNYRTLNLIISKAKNLIDNYIYNSYLQGKIFTPLEVKSWYEKNYDFTGSAKHTEEYFHEFFEKFTNRDKKGNANYKAVLVKLNLFNKPATFNQFDRDYVKSLVFYLKNDNGGLHETSAKSYYSKIKLVYKEWCMVLNVDYNSKIFEGFRFKNQLKKTRRALSWHELEKLKNLTFGESKREKTREKIRDIFVFMCYTSRYFKELKNLTFEENFFLEGKDGDLPVIKGKRKKTGEYFEIPLYPKLVEDIFNKHNQERKGEFFKEINFSSPSLSFKKHGEELTKRIGVDFDLTIITARYTFKTTIASQMPQSVVQRIMGHKNINTQDIYVGKTNSFLDDYKKAFDNPVK